ncbi:hypothetical protein ACM0CQ_02575 [Mycobacteroides abscessus subsp. abscessus]|uniref:hypothetical protein n=1 Tax=Mycobacteroides abscessus TaxID=36809 RepID=UPI0018783990
MLVVLTVHYNRVICGNRLDHGSIAQVIVWVTAEAERVSVHFGVADVDSLDTATFCAQTVCVLDCVEHDCPIDIEAVEDRKPIDKLEVPATYGAAEDAGNLVSD